MVRPEKLGVTFSGLQNSYLRLPPGTLVDLLTLDFDLVRLCVYWDRSEPEPGNYDFSATRRSLDTIEQTNAWRLREGLKPVATTAAVGSVFSPRFPEHHLPRYLQHRPTGTPSGRPFDGDPEVADRALRFLEQSIEAVRGYPSVTSIQVENEARNALPTTGGTSLSAGFLKTEIALAKRLKRPDQKILTTDAVMVGPIPGLDRYIFLESLQMADIVGVNVYGRVPIPLTNQYFEPLPEFWDRLADWRRLGAQAGVEIIASEVQAEPWENNPNLTPLSPSASAARTHSLVSNLARRGYQTQLLWGGEWWRYCRLAGYPQWWEGMRRLIQAPVLAASNV